MAELFFFDLETSGFDPRSARIMQFAGQRVDMDFKPVEEPVNILIRMTPDVLPDPDAILVTGITPQMTLQDGKTEADFLKVFESSIRRPDTIFVGYNNIRFDNEFMHSLLQRNFAESTRWHSSNGCSQWDLLDVVRMTRALRPEGIAWPYDASGSPTNRLQLLTGINGLDHNNAHDAASDVSATIAIARLLCQKQPKLYRYLLSIRSAQKVKSLVSSDQPFVYTSGAYSSTYEKTTIVVKLADDPGSHGAVVYDLRQDPTQFMHMSAGQLAEAWRWKRGRPIRHSAPPVKLLRYDYCPAVAPVSVLDDAACMRLQLDQEAIQWHERLLRDNTTLTEKIIEAYSVLHTKRSSQTALFHDDRPAGSKLGGAAADEHDLNLMAVLRSSPADMLQAGKTIFHDDRFNTLLPLYKARNFPALLTDSERADWEAYRFHRLLDGGASSRMAMFAKRLEYLYAVSGEIGNRRFLLDELQLYAASIMPEPGN